jgi:FkbM family methyltransferase
MNPFGIGDRQVLGRILRLPLRAIPASARVPILRGALRGKTWIVGSSTHGCWLGSYEYAKRVAFEALVPAGSTVFDVGAHVGFYTLLAAQLAGPSGRVVAFEPASRNLRYLREHLRLNGTSNVTVVEAAVSDRPGSACFEEGASSQTGRLDPAGLGLAVETVTLDDLVARGVVPGPDVIKMDIEGGELRALLGAKRMLEERHPAIFLATHGREVHRECCELLTALSYALRTLDGKVLEESDEILATVRRS